MINVDGRHPGVAQVAQHLEPNPNLPPHLLSLSQACAALADHMITTIPDGPELTAGLRKLLEAKDCFVRARLDGDRN